MPHGVDEALLETMCKVARFLHSPGQNLWQCGAACRLVASGGANPPSICRDMSD